MTRLLLALPVPGMMVGAALADPISVAAQTITPADLVGAWMQRPDVQLPAQDTVLVIEAIRVYRPDSTYVVHTRTGYTRIRPAP